MLSVRGKSALSTIPLGARRQFILDHELGETCEPTLAVHGPRVGLVLQPSSGGSGGSSATAAQGGPVMLLPGPLVLQLVSWRDVSQPQAASAEGGGSNRLLVLTLTDGTATCEALEYMPLKQLSAAALHSSEGVKLQLRGVPVHDGMLLLGDACVGVLGGSVAAIQEAAQQQRAQQQLDEARLDGSTSPGPPRFEDAGDGPSTAAGRERSGGTGRSGAPAAAQPAAQPQPQPAAPALPERRRRGRGQQQQVTRSSTAAPPRLNSSSPPSSSSSSSIAANAGSQMSRDHGAVREQPAAAAAAAVAQSQRCVDLKHGARGQRAPPCRGSSSSPQPPQLLSDPAASARSSEPVASGGGDDSWIAEQAEMERQLLAMQLADEAQSQRDYSGASAHGSGVGATTPPPAPVGLAGGERRGAGRGRGRGRRAAAAAAESTPAVVAMRSASMRSYGHGGRDEITPSPQCRLPAATAPGAAAAAEGYHPGGARRGAGRGRGGLGRHGRHGSDDSADGGDTFAPRGPAAMGGPQLAGARRGAGRGRRGDQPPPSQPASPDS
jgi:hypothetical protein